MRVLTRKDRVDDFLNEVRLKLEGYDQLASSPLDEEQRYDPMEALRAKYEQTLSLLQASDYEAIEALWKSATCIRWPCDLCSAWHDRVVVLHESDTSRLKVCGGCLAEAVGALEYAP